MPARFLILYGDRRSQRTRSMQNLAPANLLYRRGPTVCASAYGRATSLAHGDNQNHKRQSLETGHAD